jgi:hypothetical protein
MVMALMTVIGCRSTSTGQNHPTARTIQLSASDLAAGQTLTPDEAVNSDPCAIRLHDIAGDLLLYYAVNKRLPERLEDLRSLGADETEPDFTCPLTHQPYVYVPNGLIGPGESKRIIVYDAIPAHNGKRFCILMPIHDKPGAAQSVEVLAVPEARFSTYLPTGN